MKIATVMCSCGDSLKNIDWDELQRFYNEKKINEEDYCVFHSNLCSKEGKSFIKEIHIKNNPDSIVFAACTPKTAGYLFEDLLKDIKVSPFKVIGANLREHVGWITPDKELATKKAKATLYAAYKKANYVNHVESVNIPMSRTAVIIGAGPAGIQAAQDLAEKGHEVNLIERNLYIGGNAIKLGHFFPSDDCSACLPTFGLKGVHQSNVRRCFYRSAFDLNPRINLFIRSEVIDVKGTLGNYNVTVKTKPTYVNMTKCVNCGLCSKACPIERPDELNLRMIPRKAIYLPNITTSPTKYVINRHECPEGCSECVKACPVNAIDLDMQETTQTITAGGIILATGFQPYDASLVEEYHYGQLGYENVITQSELARLLDITGPTGGQVTKKDGDPANKVAVILCAGSRSKKYNIWCSNICCMIGIKHAIAIKEKNPKADVTIFYIDIRAVGPVYEEYYTKARMLGVKFIRGRPSSVETDGKDLYVYAEDSATNKLETFKADIVALSMAMVPSPGIQELAEKLKVDVDKAGYFKELYSKLRTSETKQAGIFAAGSAIAPADVPTTVTRAAFAASQLNFLLRSEAVEKRFPTAEIDKDKCITCEVCISACPYGAIEAIAVENPGTLVQINPISCVGCGQCQSICPVSAIEIDYYKERQIMDQVEGALYDAAEESEPIIIAFACWECAYASIDYIGQMGLTKSEMHYPHNVRVIPTQCTGNISVGMIQKTFELGADGILIVGCLEDRCHYETGSRSSSHRVTMLKQILAQSGMDSRRLEKEFIFCSNSDKFVSIARKMTTTLKEIGKLKRQ